MKILKVRKGVILCLLGILLVIPLGVYAKYRVTCRSAIFSDSTKVVRLYGKSVHERVLPASTTKVMTALLAMEKLPLDKYVKVSKRSTYVEPSKLYLKEGERYKVKDLIHAILLNSSNDAAVVLAEAVAGSEKAFVKMMNQRAKKLGAQHTKFANSNGLPSNGQTQYTTAYDMYLIFRRALRHKFFKAVIKRKYKTIYSERGRKIFLKTHNKILSKGWKRNIYGKTGYTHAAKACFIGTLEKGQSTLIVGVFGCSKRWDDIKHIISKYGKISL